MNRYVIFLVAHFGAFIPLTKADTTRPNIVIILADDMGWGDPQCYQPESKIPTPNLDRLAAGGIRFTDAHTPSSVCTPTRYSLLTGRYCWRTSLKAGVLDGFDGPLLGKNEITLASLLRGIGYETACVGKWHLGMQWHDLSGNPLGPREVRGFRSGENVDYTRDLNGGPLDAGFDQYFGISASLDMSPYAYLRGRRVESLPTERHESVEDTIFLNGVTGVKSPGFDVHDVLPRFGDEAVRVIREKSDAPLFLYLPLNSPHLPVAPSADSKGKSAAGDYGDFAWETDSIVGRVMDALEETGIAENTFVLFTSDNGGLWHWWDFPADDDGGSPPTSPRGDYVRQFGHQSNAGWRGTKADIFEGGHRVPFIVRWPAKVKAGQVSGALVELTDIFATINGITDAGEDHGTSGMDSISFLPVLTGESVHARAFSVHHSHSGMFALRKGDWKMVEGRGSGGFTRPRDGKSFDDDLAGQLYNLATDPKEQHNQWTADPALVANMKSMLDDIRNRSAREVDSEQR